MQKARWERNLSDLFKLICGLALVALSVLGVGGVIYHALGGGLLTWLVRLWSNHPGFALLVLIGLVTTATAVRSEAIYYWGPTQPSRLALYVFAALGTFFAATWFVSGTP